jgi:hypothetical protein
MEEFFNPPRSAMDRGIDLRQYILRVDPLSTGFTQPGHCPDERLAERDLSVTNQEPGTAAALEKFKGSA